MKLQDYLTADFPGDGVLTLLEDEYHDNFGYQWNRFNKLQLDSHNGSNESESRLLNQSELSLDYSSAIYANYENHLQNAKEGNLLCIRGNLFDLPIKKSSFDLVLCYGVIQHTGNNKLALETLSSFVKSEGKLLIDIYSNSLKHYNPWVYLIRPFFSRFVKGDKKRIQVVESFVNLIFPIQVRLLRSLHNKKGILRFLRYFINRSPNSVYGINLFLDGKISIEHAKDWSICDTNDAWTPQHDDPVSFSKWTSLISGINDKYNFSTIVIKDCGQGSCAVLKRNK